MGKEYLKRGRPKKFLFEHSHKKKYSLETCAAIVSAIATLFHWCQTHKCPKNLQIKQDS